MRQPALSIDSAFTQVAHAANEHIPVEAVGFRADAIFQVLKRHSG